MLNIAHRGFTREYPDNTIESIQAAINLGVDGVEFDIHETKDQKFIVHHDSNLLGREINALDSNEIRNSLIQDKYRIPFIEEIIDLCEGEIQLIVEVKNVCSLEQFLPIIECNINKIKPIIASFDKKILSNIQNINPNIDCGLIIEDSNLEPMLRYGSLGIRILILYYNLATTDVIKMAKNNGIDILVWGCKSEQTIETSLNTDIKGLITDFPDFVKNNIPTSRG